MKFGKKPKREEQRSLMYSEIKEEPSPGDTDSFALTMQLKVSPIIIDYRTCPVL